MEILIELMFTDIHLLLVVFYVMEMNKVFLSVGVIVLYNLQLYLAVPVVVGTVMSP